MLSYLKAGNVLHRLQNALSLAVAASLAIVAPQEAGASNPPTLTITVEKIDRDLVNDATPDMKGIKYGNEGGEIVRDDAGTYHWFTSEQFGDPYWVANRIARWYSIDGLNWSRDATWVKAGNQDQTGTRAKSNYFDPTVVYDEKVGYWYMFYVAYRRSEAKGHFLAQIYRAKSTVPGRAGLSGPYHDNDADDVVVLEPLKNPGPYEALWVGSSRAGLGAASVTLYPRDDGWMMLYAMNLLARAASPSEPFKRLPESILNPVRYGRPAMRHRDDDYQKQNCRKICFYHENPVVTKIGDGRMGAGTYLMLTGFYFDDAIGVKKPDCGYATSPDGIAWSEVRPLKIGVGDCITALSALPLSGDRIAMYFTARDKSNGSFERMSLATLQISSSK